MIHTSKITVGSLLSLAASSFISSALAQSDAPDPANIARRGAAVPFVTFEAEADSNRLKGSRVVVAGLPERDDSSPEMEASGRAFVSLTAQGDFVEMPPVQAANTLVVRHCIPDAAAGGGTSATLSLYVNGEFRQSLALSSRHAWLYGQRGQNGQSNDPAAGQAHAFWDEARFFIEGGLREGDTIRLQKDAADTANFYLIDLVDLEAATAPLQPPDDGAYLSVVDFGADGTDGVDDFVAITRCIAAAKTSGKCVWIPAGTFHQSEKFTLDGVAVRGAGMWHTHLVGTREGTNWSGHVGFQLDGEAPAVSDLSIDSPPHTSRSKGGKAFSGGGYKWRIENVWVTHTLTGPWLGGNGGLIRGCRIRSTYADGINLNNGASNNVVEHNHVRGCGDDGIAILSETEAGKPPSMNNIVRFNTVSAIWWGHNGDIAGGSGHLVEDNIFVDNGRMACFTINQPGAYQMHPLSDTIIRRNSVIRGGGNFAGQRRGAIWIFPGSTTIHNVLFQDNLILHSATRAIHLAGSNEQMVVFDRNIIDGVGEDAIHIGPEVTGSAIFRSNILRNLTEGRKPVVDNSEGKLKVTQTDNSWQ
jgi:hypothetical protein